jgi:GntR family carbon starvation induced transcriptional regulator
MLRLVETTKAASVPPPSQTSAAYTRLRSDILSGRLAPGERLKINDLAALLGVSPGAIREALSRLVPEQLVVSRDQKGFVVAPLSIEDLQDLTDLRCDVEAIALRRAVERGDTAWEGAILAAAHRLRRTPMIDADRSIALDWVDRHAAFHAAFVGTCGSARLLTLHAQLYEQSERYRGLSVLVDADRNVEAEHQALVDAALDRDTARLVELTVAHFRTTTALIVTAARRIASLA